MGTRDPPNLVTPGYPSAGHNYLVHWNPLILTPLGQLQGVEVLGIVQGTSQHSWGLGIVLQGKGLLLANLDSLIL